VQGLYSSRSCSRPGGLVPDADQQRPALSKDFVVLDAAEAEVRARALGVDLYRVG